MTAAASSSRPAFCRELVHINEPDCIFREALTKADTSNRVTVGPIAAEFGIQLRVIPAHELVPIAGPRPRLMHGDEDLLAAPRCFSVGRSAADAGAARFLQAIYETIQMSDSLLINDCVVRSDALERDKLAIACHAAKVGIPSIPTVALPYGVHAPKAIQLLKSLGAGPWIIKPRELSQGQAVLKVETEQQLRAAIDIVSQTGAAYIAQPWLKNEGEMRVYLAHGKVFGCVFRQQAEGGYLSNVARGASMVDATVPEDVLQQCLLLSESLNARYLVIDWLATPDGMVVTEWSTALAGMGSRELMVSFFGWVDREIREAGLACARDIA